MMHHMVQEHVAVDQCPRAFPDHFLAPKQLPIGHQRLVARSFQRLSRTLARLLQRRQQRRAPLKDQRRKLGGRQIQPVGSQNDGRKIRQTRHMRRQPPHRHRLQMRAPFRLVLRNPLQRPPSTRNLGIEIQQQHFRNRHKPSSIRNRIYQARIYHSIVPRNRQIPPRFPPSSPRTL